MLSSWDVGTYAGIRVRIHWTLLALMALVGWSEWQAGRSAAAGVGFMAALFGCVLLHEYGHALAARRYGIPTRSITLLPFGGIAALERVPTEPRRELVVALAGPAVNVLIALVLLPVVWLTGYGMTLLVTNIALVVFNLIPAFPMDGGRVLRALLALRTSRLRATRVAVGIGRVVAIGFAIAAFYWSPMLLLIAFVVWTQGGAELAHLEALASMSTLSPHDPLEKPLAIFARTGQSEFPVLMGQQIVGVLRREQLSLAFARFGPHMSVGSVMEPVTKAG
ncbi:MAG: site-2 protease family protein [Planctomycetota bacterium]